MLNTPDQVDQATVSTTSAVAAAPEKRELDWTNILFMTLNPLAALILTPIYLYNHGFSWGLLAFLIVTYTMSNMVITCGYHRYFSHRTYNVHPIIEALYVFFGAGAFQGSILAWSTDHRRHHGKVDSDEDPYSRSKGFWYSHITWMFYKDTHPQAEAFPRDLTKSKFIMFQHNHYALFATFVGFILPGIVGYFLGFGFWGGLIIGGSLRIALSQQSTFLINSAAHTFGTQPYTDTNSAKDSLVMAFLTFGEGYHNYHHFFQLDYRNGIRWYQWDPTKWWIDALAKVGLATKLKKVRKEEIFKARLLMEERMLLKQIATHVDNHLELTPMQERVAQMKVRLMDAQAKIKHLHDEYLVAKAALKVKGQHLGDEMKARMTAVKAKRMRKAELKMAQIEFNSAYTQWRTFRKAVRRTSSAAA